MNKSHTMITDVLVAGAGIAGIKAAYTAARRGLKVLIVTKSMTAASDYVLGFNAAVSADDSTELYAADTLKGGGHINKPELVETLAQNAAAEVKFVEGMGLEFDSSEKGYDLLKPLGCSVPRLVHIKNLTGRICLEKFRDEAMRAGVQIINNAMLADLITDNGKVTGAVIYDLENKCSCTVSAKAVVIATGGVHIASDSTYPVCMTGDGYAAAYRAGAALTDMEFIQYEPCRCIYPQKLGISTTLLAKGGKITNKHGERFLLSHFATEGEIPKDALAKLIYAEILKGNGTEHGGVYLDLTDVPEMEIIEKHSLYYNRFKNAGIDITKERIEVAPCAHSFMGGIVTDSRCASSTEGLFAAGEAMGGVHGANRVGGNAGTEIYVFGTIAGESAAEYALKAPRIEPVLPHPDRKGTERNQTYYESMKTDIQALMAKYMGPVRSAEGIEEALNILDKYIKDFDSSYASDFDAQIIQKECENLLTVCRCSCMAAAKRRESRGVHYRSDYPRENSNYRMNYVHQRGVYEIQNNS